MEYFNGLPEEITLEILIRVPTESVLECKLVCTTWRSLVRHPSFSKTHFKHHLNHACDSGELGFIAKTYSGKKNNYQYFEYNDGSRTPIDRIRRINFNPPFGKDTVFLGSVNGLICFGRDDYFVENFYICNPITRECIMLPEFKRPEGVRISRRMRGFGYVSSTNEYKVVTMMYEDHIDTEFIGVYVYTLGSGLSWRNLGMLNFGSGSCRHWEEGFFVNGALYWLDYRLDMIVPFDLAEEKFCEHLSFPLPIIDEEYELGVLDGCLSLAITGPADEGSYWNVWLLKQNDDNQGMKFREGHQSLGWSLIMCRVYDYALFAVTKSYAVLSYNGNHINIQDPEASTPKTIVDFKESFFRVFPHKNTLISLKELGEEDAKIMESVEITETKSHDRPFNQP